MNNLRGALLMIGSMAGFALADMLIKQVSTRLPVGQILLMVGAGSSLLFGALVLYNRQSLVPREILHPAVIIRNLGDVVGPLCFITALTMIPLSVATTILQSVPLLVTCGAALILGESVGWRRWAAIGVGMAGVLCIVRPGYESFQPATLLAVIAAVALAARDVVTPLVPPRLSALQLSLWGILMMIPTGAALLATGTPPIPVAPELGLSLVGIILLGGAAYMMITQAVRIAQLSAVAPFRYSRLIFAMALGMLVFGERPDAMTFLGAGMIVGAGLYTLARERALFTEARQG
ncbi:drug/metabolite transporter (DMT)-like permease [Aliiruegeria haliotis]|uniref:Drug/metabolite transporter (DMT)-like permease n=1 Tax=Aliiruegeria haliotis TaxID=1280846 RepID=A0A2T0RZY0_9RHOB|nr:DMT family transporter [Aliiruegeria haliotis]PRY26700.1 drug/metabolite transporter (DMT)-like permease [Aliiruegeria haliotis]